MNNNGTIHLDTGGHFVTHTATTDHEHSLAHGTRPPTPGHIPGGKSSNADRLGLYNPESGICGSHTNMDLDSYLALTRRKVAEKYSTTLDLITHIRRNRFGESGYVTPNEFRYTLIKLGVQMPGPMADKIFEIFDSDRSGSINFDEFAMWVMNSEFKPKERRAITQSTVEVLREKFSKWMKKYPDLARERLTQRTSLSQFHETINRKFMKMTEPEVRELFKVLDIDKCGFVDGEVAQHWVETGRLEHPEKPIYRAKTPVVLSLEEAITRICGKNVHQLEWCFLSVDPGRKNSMAIEDFTRNLTEGGLGRDHENIRALFVALGGNDSTGKADIGLLLRTLPPMLAAIANEKKERMSHAQDPRPATAKIMSAEETRLCQVDRYFREHIRKCFDAVKSALDEVDVTGSGFVDPDVLRAIVTKHCCPIAPSDFLYLTNKTRRKKDRDDGKVQWLHFLQVYGTRAAPHILQGPGFSQAALALRKQYLLANPNADKNWFLPRPKHAKKGTYRDSRKDSIAEQAPGSPSSSLLNTSLQPNGLSMSMSLDLTATASKTNGLPFASSSGAGDEQGLGEGNNHEDNVDQQSSSSNHSNSKALMLQQVQQRPKTAPGPDLGKSFSIQSFNSVGNSSSGMLNSSASAGDISPAGGGLAAARQRIADQRAKLQGILATMELEKQLQTGVLGSVLGPGGSGPLGTVSKKINMESEAEKAVRKTWAAVLKDCHKCDPQGLGCVSREDFLMALSNGALKETMDEIAMEELAMTYAIDGSEGRMIDYLTCFKVYLMQAAEKFHPSDSTIANETGKKLEVKNHQKQPPRAEGLKHPWEFEYFKRKEGRNKGPAYWEKALLPKIDAPSAVSTPPSSASPAALLASATSKITREAAVSRGVKALSGSERDAVIGQYAPDIQELCIKCYALLKPSWREVRLDFKEHEILKHRGTIFNYHFLDILAKYGIVLTVWEKPKLCHAFRTKGMGHVGVISFDDFQRACMLTAIEKIKAATKGTMASPYNQSNPSESFTNNPHANAPPINMIPFSSLSNSTSGIITNNGGDTTGL